MIGARGGEFWEELSDRLAKLMLERNTLAPEQSVYAHQKRKVEGKPLWQVLVDNGLAREHDVCSAFASLQGNEFVDASGIGTPSRDVLEMFNKEQCLKAEFLPMRREGDRLVVLLADARPSDVANIVLRRCGLRCSFLQGEFSRVRTLIRHSYFFAINPIEDLIEQEIRRLTADKEGLQSPDVFVDHLLHMAVQERATDIHFSPGVSSIHILMRVDGVLQPMYALAPDLARIVSYVKLVAQMDISEKRRPQDGSFRARVLDVPYAIRLSTVITDHGERLVMRLLPESHDLKGLIELGFYPKDAALVTQAMSKPSGLVVITGPTGSGKSSTLHAGLRMQRLIERNVLTVEDPIEYRVPGAAQTEVNRKAGYDFKVALRHFLRHDPDVMLVGEMRDSETVLAALDASATGHLVLSTLHVTTVFGVLPRLMLLGALPQVIASNLLLVINQRLVRRNCSSCSQPVAYTQAECRWLGKPIGAMGMRGVGCPKCRNTGYHGRVPVYEMLSVDAQLGDLIAADAPRSVIREAATQAGFVDIEVCAKQRVIDGLTTSEEVERAVGVGP